MRRVAGLMMMVVFYLSTASVWPIADAHGQEAGDVTPTTDGQPKPSQRLKYRRGPVCMCSTGLSEQEIEAAERRRREGRLRETPETGDAQNRRN